MAIERRGNQWYVRFQVRGEKFREPTGLDASRENETAARAFEKRRRAEVQLGLKRKQQASKSAAFCDLAAAFLNWCESTEYRSRRSTCRRIRTSFASLSEFFGAMPVNDLGPAQVEDYKTWRATVQQVKDITIRHDLDALSLFFHKYAVKRRLAASNPVDEVQRPSDKDAVRIHILTPQEEQAYFDVAAKSYPQLYDFGRLMILQGCRPEDLYSLTAKNVDFERNYLMVHSKTDAGRRELEMLDETALIMKRLVRQAEERGTPWLFQGRRKGHHLVKINSIHDQVCIEAGVSFVPYDFRHTWATRMLTDAKNDVATVAALLGHKGLRTVAKYLHPQQQAKDEAMRKYQATLRAPLRKVK